MWRAVAQADGRPDLQTYEQWFLDRGVPHFIVGYSAGEDIWTRALPLLLVAYFLGGLNALDLHGHSLGWNLAVAAIVVAILLAAWAVTGLARGRPFSVPRRLGPAELAVFVVGPVIPSLVFGQWRDAGESFAEGLTVLAVVYLVTSYAVLPLLRWTARQAGAQLSTFFDTFVRVLPLLLVAITFLFLSAEVWQVAGLLDSWRYVVAVGVFFAFGSLFVLSRIPSLIDGVTGFERWEEVAVLCVGTPGESCRLPTDDAGGGGRRHTAPGEPPLRRRERANVGLVAVFSQALQITLVAAAVFAFFVGFGALAIPAETVGSWTGEPANVLLGAGRVALTEELLRVAGFLAAFTGMYFTVVLSTDATYREEFADDVAPRIRQALAVRAAYHLARSD